MSKVWYYSFARNTVAKSDRVHKHHTGEIGVQEQLWA